MPSALADRAARLRTWPGGTRPLLGAGAAIVLLLGAVLAWAFWGGAPGHSGTAYPPGPVPSAATTLSPAVVPSGGAPSQNARPGTTGGTDPAAQNAKGFLNELGAIDPGLAANPNAALSAGRA